MQRRDSKKIANYVDNLKTLNDRLQALEARPIHNPNDFPALPNASQPQQLQQFIQDHMRPALQTEITEYDRIQSIKLNLVCSGIKESDLTDEEEVEAADRTTFINLIKDEFNIIADVEKVKRFGRKKNPTEGTAPPPPRLLKIRMKDQKTRKLILSKAVTLRNSANEYVSQNVYIRPDQTLKQQEESKNLRDQLKLKRQQNQGRTFKIYRGQIKDVTVPQEQPEVNHD